MSFNTSVQVTETVPSHLMMHLQPSPSIRVKEQVEVIKKAIPTLPYEFQADLMQSLLDWEQAFFSNYHIESKKDSDRENAAHSLLFLIFNNIDYIMGDCTRSKVEMVKWLIIKNALTDIVKSILSHTNVEKFIKVNKQKFEDTLQSFKFAQTINEIKQKVTALFEQLEEQWYECGDKILSDLQIEFEVIKQMLIDLHNQRKVAVEELHKEIDNLTKEMTQVYQVQGKQLKDAELVGKDISKHKDFINQLLNVCEARINKL